MSESAAPELLKGLAVALCAEHLGHLRLLVACHWSEEQDCLKLQARCQTLKAPAALNLPLWLMQQGSLKLSWVLLLAEAGWTGIPWGRLSHPA